jgi:hypothetical protein
MIPITGIGEFVGWVKERSDKPTAPAKATSFTGCDAVTKSMGIASLNPSYVARNCASTDHDWFWFVLNESTGNRAVG